MRSVQCNVMAGYCSSSSTRNGSSSNIISGSVGYYYSKKGKRAGRRAFLFQCLCLPVPGAGEDCSRRLATWSWRAAPSCCDKVRRRG